MRDLFGLQRDPGLHQPVGQPDDFVELKHRRSLSVLQVHRMQQQGRRPGCFPRLQLQPRRSHRRLRRRLRQPDHLLEMLNRWLGWNDYAAQHWLLNCSSQQLAFFFLTVVFFVHSPLIDSDQNPILVERLAQRGVFL
ncbi:hypothetical protein CTA2_877 [Colletotrichum tanaceti]|nr:hypothetical protein CTA2_877 [Colletotrichum tanaceti]